MLSALGRFVFWDFKRASWQYDVMVALILLFIFATPRRLFLDTPKAPSVVMLPAEGSSHVFWIEPELLAGVADEARAARAAGLIHNPTGKKERVVKVTPIFDNEQDLKGYYAHTKP